MSSGGGGGGAQNTTQTSLPPPFQIPFIEDVLGQAQTLNRSGGPAVFPESGVAPFQPAQLAGQQQQLDFAAGSLPGLAGNAIAANQFGLGPILDPASNPYLQAYAQNAALPIVRNLQQSVLPSIAGNAVGAGQFGGSRQGIAEGLAAQATIDAVERQSTGIFNQGYANALDAFVKSQALAPQTLALGTRPGEIVSAVGGAQQAQDQAQINDIISRFSQGQQRPFENLAFYRDAVLGNFGGTTTGTGSASGGPGTLEKAVGGALTGLSAAPAIAPLFGFTGAAGAAAFAPWAAGAFALASIIFD
jgi:hypothetical protein